MKRTSKSGSIVTEVVDGRLQAARLDGRFWMYWGEGTCWAATSTDLVRWTPVEYDPSADRYLTFDPASSRWGLARIGGAAALRPVLFPRRRRFDSLLVEARTTCGGDRRRHRPPLQRREPPRARRPVRCPRSPTSRGRRLFDPEDPASCIARTTEPFLRPDQAAEQQGQVDNVCFAQGLVLFEGRWHLYHGMADSRIGCATAVSSR